MKKPKEVDVEGVFEDLPTAPVQDTRSEREKQAHELASLPHPWILVVVVLFAFGVIWIPAATLTLFGLLFFGTIGIGVIAHFVFNLWDKHHP